MPEAKSLIILGFVVWDENFNSVVLSVPTPDRQRPYIYGFYYDIMDTELTPDKPYSRDLCAEQPLCKSKELCIKACTFQAIIPGPLQGFPLPQRL